MNKKGRPRMSNLYLPEGRLLNTPENQAACACLPAVQKSMEQALILEGRAVLCTPDHDLSVTVGPFTGIIPREEAALGIREGNVREIAILSRVGKPISFVVTALDLSGPTPLLQLSRRRAQELALNRLLDEVPPGSVIPATVTHLESFGTFVDIGCGFISMIGIENSSVSRISHPACRFSIGQEIYAVISHSDREQERIFLSHKELLGTWEENAQRFSPGMTVPGIVRGVKSYGIFVELTPNLAGLADQVGGLEENDRVSVYIKSIQPDRMKIKLSIIHKLEPNRAPEPLSYYITAGQLSHWQYSPPNCTRTNLFTDFPNGCP